MKKILHPLAFILVIFLSLYGCSAEEEETASPTSVVQTPDPQPATIAEYTLTISAEEGGTVSTEGGTYDEGTEVTITAVAADGYEFTGWTGIDSIQTSLTITVGANLTLVANFTANAVSSSDKFELHYPIDVKGVLQTEIENIYSTSAAKMGSRNAEILTIVYPIGDFVSEGGDWEGGRFNTFETILGDDAITLIRAKLTEWFTTFTDIPDAFLSEIVEEYMVYIEGGADLSSHFGVTESARLVIIAAPPSMSVTDFKKVIIHELYHAYQQDLESESCRDLEEASSDSNSKWLIEGAAEYFAQTHAEDLGYSGTGRSALLQTALGDYNESVSEGAESPESLGPNATTAAAAMYLMVLKGYIQEAVIFDGSLFYYCAREIEYGPSNSDLQFIKDNWFKINSDSGIYSFQSEVLNPDTFSIDVTATSSSDYTLSGSDRNGNVSGSDPDLTFNVGDTINFVVSASGHPFYLKTAAGTGTGDTISGVTNNGSDSATISWTPDSTGTFYYQCSLHGGMVGTITIQ